MFSKTVIRFLFLLYSIAVFYMVFIEGDRHVLLHWTDRINLVPVRSLIRFYQTSPHQSRFYFIFLSEILGNLLLLLPFGFILKCFYPCKHNFSIVVYGLLLSIGIEVTQLLLQIGVCDIDDLILNTTGAAAGVFFYTKMRNAMQRKIVREG